MISRRSAAWCVCLLIASLASTSAAIADAPFNPDIKIKLARFFPIGTTRVDISSDQAFMVTDQNGASVVQAPSGASLEFDDQSGIKVSVSPQGATQDSEEDQSGLGGGGLTLTVHSAAGSFVAITTVGPTPVTHRYRGDIEVFPGLNLVNVLPLEEYLKGVLKPEIGAGAPLEALKAQAVASRTYTIFNMGKMIASGADMDDTTRTQSYVGADGETDSIDSAVDGTSGQVLLYNGTPINALFSTDCGGMTAAGSVTEPYLTPVADSECSAEPGWTLDLSSAEAEALIAPLVDESAGECSIRVVETDSSGRASQVKLSRGDQDTVISGIQFRKMVGYDRLRSTLFKVSKKRDGSFHLTGKGWGHGLGLCQHGAIYLAQHDALYTEILNHYYSGTVISQLTSSMLPVAPVLPSLSPVPTSSTPPGP